VILYADQITGSMERAIEQTNRRREKQVEYNTANGITREPTLDDIGPGTESKIYRPTSTREANNLGPSPPLQRRRAGTSGWVEEAVRT
jgi:excinuclease UvrABC helicase subunit UvrB